MPRPALAADRALQVIDLLAVHPTERFTLTEISRRTGVNSASAHALLSALHRRGYVQRHPQHKTYALGPALVAAGVAALDQLPGVRVAQAEIAAVSDELDLEALVTAVGGDEIIVVGRAAHASAYGATMVVGQRLPLAPPLGSIFLAWSTAATIRRWLARAEPALTPQELRQQQEVLSAVRSRGYSIAVESNVRREIGAALEREARGTTRSRGVEIGHMVAELSHSPYHVVTVEPEATYDVSMVAAAIFDANREVTASIAVSGFAPGVVGAELVRVGEHLRGVARMITKRSKGRPPRELD